MNVKIYSINNCIYCDKLRDILTDQGIAFEEVKVLRMGEEGTGIPFSEYISLQKEIPLHKKCNFPQIYIDGDYIGDLKSAITYFTNENK